MVNSWSDDKVWAKSYWIYFAGPFAASVVAAAIYKFVLAEETDEAVAEPAGEPAAEPAKESDEGKGSGSDHV